MSFSSITIGTRGSPLALWQANWVKSEIEKVYPELTVLLKIIKTTGDKLTDVSLSEVGGKALFTKEIEEALLAKEIDVAVHSLKDMPTDLPEGLVLAAYPERENPYDAFISRTKVGFQQLPPGSKVGTSSIRRRCQLKNLRPDLTYVEMRGNVDTRLKKLAAGECDAIVLAAAGLNRLGLSSHITEILPLIPAVGQGCLAIETSFSNNNINKLVEVLNDRVSQKAVEAERAYLEVMGGSCQVPLSCFARPTNTGFHLTAFVSSLDGQDFIKMEKTASSGGVKGAARDLARQILEQGGGKILEAIRASSPTLS